MGTISVLNTDSGLSGKTIQNLEDSQTVTGLKTFNRAPNAPFAVQAGSANVSNLDADKLDGLDSLDFVKADGTVGMTGALNLSNAAAGQVKFPATQNASSDANTLDDYEEGTWTPSIKGSTSASGQAYTEQAGNYVKIGKQVTAWAKIVLSTLGTITGNVEIGELPFASAGFVDMPGSVANFSGLTSSFVFLSGVVLSSGSTRFRLQGLKSAATSVSNLAQADLSATTTIELTVTYLASA